MVSIVSSHVAGTAAYLRDRFTSGLTKRSPQNLPRMVGLAGLKTLNTNFGRGETSSTVVLKGLSTPNTNFGRSKKST